MKRPDRTPVAVSQRQFKVIHQSVGITGISFERKSLVGFVELSLIALQPHLKTIRLNCKQSQVVRVTFNETEDANFSQFDPLLHLDGSQSKDFSQVIDEYIQAVQMSETESEGGELMVEVPRELWPSMEQKKLVKLGVQFRLENPSFGVQFVVPQTDGSLRERGSHCFTCKHENSARLWLPSVDSFNELCTWKLEITVDILLTAVASGDLVNTVYTADMQRKTWHYQILTPTPAQNVGFAVGPFDVLVHPDMHEVAHFCLPQLLPLLKNTVGTLHKSFEFFEELLSSRYPYSSYKQVFVDECPVDLMSFSSFSILSTNLLYHKGVIDQVPVTRILMALGVSQQFFGCFVVSQTWSDCWLVKGIAAYINGLFVQKFFGNNEYLYSIYESLNEVSRFEEIYGGILLRPRVDSAKTTDYYGRLGVMDAHSCSPLYAEGLRKKAHLAIRLLEKKLGQELLFQVLNKLLSVCSNAAQQKTAPVAWNNMLLSTNSFLRCISNVTGQDMQSYMEQWILASGHAKFNVSFSFSRKRNVLELEVRQDKGMGLLPYLGPLSISVQELDGAFSHTIQIDDLISKHDIQCHSKARRQKKKKIPLWTGDEVDIDLSLLDPDSPVLWIRFDPELLTIRKVQLQQPDYHWQYELKHEKDVLAQIQAVEMLSNFPTPQSRQALIDVIEDERIFYRVRMMAAATLAEVENNIATSWSTTPVLIGVFQKMFGSLSCPKILKPNNFSNFQLYHVQKALILALGRLRYMKVSSVLEAQRFLVDLLKYNMNNSNKYVDDYHRAAIVDAIGYSLTPKFNRGFVGSAHTEADFFHMCEAVALQLNMDKLLPSYKSCVSASCIKTLYKLQKYSYINMQMDMFVDFAEAAQQFVDVRLAAFDCIADHIVVTSDGDLLLRALKIISSDLNPNFRLNAAKILANLGEVIGESQPKFSRDHISQLFETIRSFAHDSSVRCLLLDATYMITESAACLKKMEGEMNRFARDIQMGDDQPTDFDLSTSGLVLEGLSVGQLQNSSARISPLSILSQSASWFRQSGSRPPSNLPAVIAISDESSDDSDGNTRDNHTGSRQSDPEYRQKQKKSRPN